MAVSRTARILLDVIRDEGGTILEITPGGRHHKVYFTFDGETRHMQPLRVGSKEPTDRNVLNFRAQVRRLKPNR